jgi:hypothetical protein
MIWEDYCDLEEIDVSLNQNCVCELKTLRIKKITQGTRGTRSDTFKINPLRSLRPLREKTNLQSV